MSGSPRLCCRPARSPYTLLRFPFVGEDLADKTALELGRRRQLEETTSHSWTPARLSLLLDRCRNPSGAVLAASRFCRRRSRRDAKRPRQNTGGRAAHNPAPVGGDPARIPPLPESAQTFPRPQVMGLRCPE